MLPKTWDYIDPENEQIPTEEQRKELENCPRFLYYVQKYRDEKKKKFDLIKWLENNWIALAGLLIGFISILPIIL